jgi:hypothetical protein
MLSIFQSTSKCIPFPPYFILTFIFVLLASQQPCWCQQSHREMILVDRHQHPLLTSSEWTVWGEARAPLGLPATHKAPQVLSLENLPGSVL